MLFTLIRDIIKIKSVRSKLIEPGYGYIRVSQFQENTGESLAEIIRELFAETEIPMEGLVLDLRNDPGGLLNGAVAVSAAFLPKDALVVYTEGRTDEAKMNLHANPRFYLRGTRNDYMKGLPADIKTVPMITLVNGGSASASEIVAGALQDNDRSVVMGSQTFGKGSVQTILPLSGETAIKLTTALYYTPNGVSIQAKGITPDIIDNSDVNDLRRLREADLNRHLSNGSETEDTDNEPAIEVKPESESKSDDDEKEEKAHKEPIEFGSSEDLLLAKAIEYLKGETPWPEMNKDKASD